MVCFFIVQVIFFSVIYCLLKNYFLPIMETNVQYDKICNAVVKSVFIFNLLLETDPVGVNMISNE